MKYEWCKGRTDITLMKYKESKVKEFISLMPKKAWTEKVNIYKCNGCKNNIEINKSERVRCYTRVKVVD